MPRPFNRQPRGLLSFLDGKVPSAQNPQLFEEAIRIVVDGTNFYAAQQASVVQENTGLVGVPDFYGTLTGTGVVPQDEVWLVQRHTVGGAALAAGETLGIYVAMRRVQPGGAGAIYILQTTSGSGGIFAVGQTPIAAGDTPYYALPGDSLGVYIFARGVFAGALTVNLDLVRLKI